MGTEQIFTRGLLESLADNPGALANILEPALAKEFAEWLAVELDNSILVFGPDKTDETGVGIRACFDTDLPRGVKGWGLGVVVGSIVRGVEDTRHPDDLWVVDDAELVATALADAADSIMAAAKITRARMTQVK